MNDEALVNNTLQDTTQLLPISRKPVFCKVVCSNSGIPRHEDEHRRLQEWQRGAIPDNPGLHTGGFGWGNIGMNDMISESQRMTATFLAGSAFSACTHQPEFVYF
jgi:protoporphyrinogen oxidase